VTFDVVDTVWLAMKDGEYYSPSDLANSLGQPIEEVTRVLEFLAKYDFAQQVAKSEMLFRKLASAIRPGDALRVLQTVLQGGDVNNPNEIASLPKAPKHFR